MSYLQPCKLVADELSLWTNFFKLINEYDSIYINAYKKTLSQTNNVILPNSYELFLKNIDEEFSGQLRSKRFTSVLSSYLDSLVDLRNSCKEIGLFLGDLDKILYEMKKIIFQFPSAEELRKSPTATPSEVVLHRGQMELIHYRPEKPEAKPILFTSAQINRFNLMDLKPDRSVIRNLLSQGFDVYLVNWGYSGSEDNKLSIKDYFDHLHDAVELVCQTTGRKKIPMIGYCWGGLVSIMYAALKKYRIESLVLIATPVDFSKDNSILAVWSKELDVDKIINEFGQFDPLILDAAFYLRNPARTYDKYMKFFSKINDLSFAEDFFTLEKWLYNTPPVPGEFARKILKDCYQNNLLIANKMMLDDQIVKLDEIDFPVLVAYAEKDDLVSPDSSLAFIDMISSKEKKVISLSGGHVGLCISRAAQENLWPEIGKWILLHNSTVPKKEPRAPTEMITV
jgi:polyhydroxyalkanoate synthase